MNTALILAADNPSWDTGILGVVAGALKIAAALIVLAALFKGVKDVMAGKPGNAVKIGIGAVVLATFLWNPTLIGDIIDAFGGVSQKGIEQVGDLTDSGAGHDTSGVKN